MFEKIRIVFSIAELRKKILLTIGLIAVYRLGWNIFLPMVDTKMQSAMGGIAGFGDLLSQVAVFSGTQLDQMTIFGLGIMPYISASIIFQLLATVYEPLERLQKEGESGRKKINEYTRYATILICIIQSMAYLSMLNAQAGQQMLERLPNNVPFDVRRRKRPFDVSLVLARSSHDDHRNGVPYVARRTNRRIRYRQRYQPLDYGRYFGSRAWRH